MGSLRQRTKAGEMPSWLTTTLSVLAGGLLTMLSAWLADGRLRERDRERRRDERQERFAIRRDDFQRETLLALQVASQELLRNTGAALLQDIAAHRKTGEWQRQALVGDLSDDALRLNTQTMLLGSRILDNEVREMADKLRTQAVHVSHSQNEIEAQQSMTDASNTQQALVRRIGKLLRELDGAASENSVPASAAV